MLSFSYSKSLTASDLPNCRIKVSSQSPEDFYGQPLPTVPNLDPNLVSGTLDMQGLSDETYHLLQSLDLASKATPDQESPPEEFVRELLRSLGYETHDLLSRSRYTIPLLRNSYSKSSAETADLCLVQGSSTVLLVVKVDNNLAVGAHDPEPQVIAGAIATFQCNNRIRSRLGEPELDSMAIQCIAMVGTRPTFYLVPVTQHLSESIIRGTIPTVNTVVTKCVVVSNRHLLSEGMESPDFRQVALQHFTTFRTLAMAHWPVL